MYTTYFPTMWVLYPRSLRYSGSSLNLVPSPNGLAMVNTPI